MCTTIKRNWDRIDAAIKHYIDLGIQPNVYENHEIFKLYPKDPPRNYSLVHNKNVSSKKLCWYEITFTYPDKDISRVQKSIDRLKKYSKYTDIHGRFEIGKGGAYHMHFLVKTYAYMRVSKIHEINAKKGYHFTKLEGRAGFKWQQYIEKDVGKDSDPEWVKFNFDDVRPRVI